MRDRLRILKSTGSKSRCSIFPKAASSRRKNRSLGEASVSRILRYAVLAYLFLATQLNLAARDVPLAAGNLLRCTLDEPNLSPRTVKVGDPIVCYARPEQIFGCSLFPRGTQWAGRFVEYKDPGRFVGKGWIRLDFDRLILPNGIAPISARVISVRGFKVDAEAGFWVMVIPSATQPAGQPLFCGRRSSSRYPCAGLVLPLRASA